MNRKKGEFQYTASPAPCEIKVLAAAEHPQELLRAEIEAQINSGFDLTGNFLPFRFFVIRDKESFYLGLVYFHAVADAVSVVSLLRQICAVYSGDGPLCDAQPFKLARQKFRFAPLALGRKLVGFVALLRQHRRSVRVAHRKDGDGRNRFEQLTLGHDKLQALAAAAKAWEVTLNDIFLAMVLLCCAPFTLHRFAKPNRRRIAVGCIVNTRHDLELDNPQGWGLFLGSFVVAQETPAGLGLRELSRDIRRQTAALKQRKNYVGTSLELVLGRFLLSFFSTAHRTKLYQKHYPLWGGVTNMNLNSLWPPSADTAPVDYFRGVSTGPVTPLVLSVTTVRDRVNLGFSFRTATFTEAHIEQVKRHLLKLLEPLNSHV